MKEENNIERLFQDTFEGFEMTPPPAVKSAIDKGIATKRGGMGWFLGALIVLIIGSLFAWKFLSTTNNTSNHPQLAQTEQEDNGTAEDNVSEASSAAVASVKSTDLSSKNAQNESLLVKETPSVRGKNENNQSTQKNGEVVLPSSKEEQNNTNQNAKKETNKQTNLRTKQEQTKTALKPVKSNTNPKRKQAKALKNRVVSPVQVNENKETIRSSKVTNPYNGNNGLTKNEIFSPTSSSVNSSSSSTTNDNGIQKTTSDTATSLANNNATIDTANAANSNSSVVNNEQPNNNKPADKNSNNSYNWMIALNGGPTFGSRAASEGLSIKEKTGYQFGIGVTRSFNTSLPLAVGLDFEYGSRKENYIQQIGTDSTYYFLDSIPIYDSVFTDSIVGFQVFQNSDSTTFYSYINSGATVNRYAFGLSIPITVFTSNQFGVIVTPGFRYSLNTFVFNDGSPSLKLASYHYKIGLDLYYDWKRFRFSAGLDSRFEQLSKNTNQFTQDRSRWMFVPNVGVGFKF